jgi:hypothetical protein
LTIYYVVVEQDPEVPCTDLIGDLEAPDDDEDEADPCVSLVESIITCSGSVPYAGLRVLRCVKEGGGAKGLFLARGGEALVFLGFKTRIMVICCPLLTSSLAFCTSGNFRYLIDK